jgi:phage tail-like protein
MALERHDPYLANRFKVEIEGVVEAAFSECSGLVVETEVEERREGGQNLYAHRLPRGSRFVNLVLKRGLTDSDKLWAWHQEVVGGKLKRRTLSVVLFDGAGDERWRWNLQEAYPTKWVGPELKADAGLVAIESLELVHHGLSRGR